MSRSWSWIATALVACALLGASLAGTQLATASAARSDPVLVRFERSGGFAGWTTSVVVRASGHARIVDRTGAARTVHLAPARVARIERRIAAADLPSLTGRYVTPGAADLYVYSITADGTRVVADELAVPLSVEPLVRTLATLLG